MKSIFRAYCLAIIGLIFGIIGMHRFYLGFFNTGMLMAMMFFGGVCCFAIGYFHLLAPFLTALSSVGGDLAALAKALPADGALNLESKPWFLAGIALCVSSLCWLAVDLLFMPQLAAKANQT